MKVSIIGTGYVGLVNGACLSEMGADVTCIDINEEKITKLENGEIPIYEPGLEEMIKRNVAANRLHFSTSYDSIKRSNVTFIAVGTPPDEDGSADLKYVLAAAHKFGETIEMDSAVIVTKSTVPIGTSHKVKDEVSKALSERGAIWKNLQFSVASNPEFLKEGSAIKDCMYPDRIVVGTDDENAKKVMSALYTPFMLNKTNIIFTTIGAAEVIKYYSNAMLATRISISNEMANFCHKNGIPYNDVRRGVGADSRIGDKFLFAGPGYGGSCFPKDVKALIKTAEQCGCEMKVLNAVEEVNEKQKTLLAKMVINKFDGKIENKSVTILGLAFKPETDDMREAPSLTIIDELLKNGAKVKVYDPIAMTECKRRMGNSVEYCKDMYDAVANSDAVLLVTEWKEFRLPDWKRIKSSMNGNLIIDGRNIYNKEEVESFNLEYDRIG